MEKQTEKILRDIATDLELGTEAETKTGLVENGNREILDRKLTTRNSFLSGVHNDRIEW